MLTFEELIDFIEHRMRMSHIYQPLLIRTLVDAGGTATLRQVAMWRSSTGMRARFSTTRTGSESCPCRCSSDMASSTAKAI